MQFSVPIHVPSVDLHKSCSLCGGRFVASRQEAAEALFFSAGAYPIISWIGFINLYANLMVFQNRILNAGFMGYFSSSFIVLTK